MVGRRARGDLEAAVLRLLWERDAGLTGRDVQAVLAQRGDELAQTTVLTVLSRMVAKGLVERESDAGSASVFRAAHSETATAAASMSEALAGVRDRRAALQRFTGGLSEDDLAALRAALDGPER